MTRKHVDKKAAVLAIRRRSADIETKSDMYTEEQLNLASSQEPSSFRHEYPQMYRFGPGASAHTFFEGSDNFQPYSLPTLQFPAPMEVSEEELPQPHLLYSYISAELNASGVRFEGYVHPFMNDSIADENGQPQITLADAGRCD